MYERTGTLLCHEPHRRGVHRRSGTLETPRTPLLTAVPGPVPSTSPTDDPFLPEGFPTVVVQVEEMTDDGFIGIVTELYGAARPEAGTKLYVTITADTRYLTADGSLVPAQEAWQDHTGCCVAVEFLEYDEETASVTANILSVESEAMP